MSTTPSRAALKQGLLVDVEVGGSLTLHPGPATRTIVVRLIEKTGRRAKLRVQSHDAVQVSTQEDEKLASAG